MPPPPGPLDRRMPPRPTAVSPSPIILPPPTIQNLAYVTEGRGGPAADVLSAPRPGKGRQKENYRVRSRYMYENKQNMDIMPENNADILGNWTLVERHFVLTKTKFNVEKRQILLAPACNWVPREPPGPRAPVGRPGKTPAMVRGKMMPCG